MFDFRTTITAKLKAHQLPVIRQTAAQVISLLSSDNCDIKKVSDTILRDQAFTARILRTANSAFYQRQAEKITTISRAVITIGFAALRDIALASEFAEFAQKKLPTSVNLNRLLARAFVAAQQSTALGNGIRLPEAEALFTSALLESLGGFALASVMPDFSSQIQDTANATGLPYDQVHVQVTGMTPHDVTVIVAKNYGFPDELIVHPPDWATTTAWNPLNRRQAVVHFSNACATNLFAPESSEILIEFATLMAQASIAMGLPILRLESLLTEGYHKAIEIGATVNLDQTLFALEGTSADSAGRNSLIQTCAELATQS
jgi:HD-like signal output (HDOD) protein